MIPEVLDLKRHYRELGGEPHPYMEQNGMLYCWSESNVQFELAWWWYTDSTTPLVNALKKERVLPPEGLTILNRWNEANGYPLYNSDGAT